MHSTAPPESSESDEQCAVDVVNVTHLSSVSFEFVLFINNVFGQNRICSEKPLFKVNERNFSLLLKFSDK